MFRLLLLAVAIAFATRFVITALGLPLWSYYALLAFLALALYVTNTILIQRFISRRAPDFASTEEVADGVQEWELTAGTGAVPRWVSWIGLTAMACFLAIVFTIVVALIS